MDTEYNIALFPHNASQIGRWVNDLCGVWSEASVYDNRVVIHPRPRQLTTVELAQIEAVLLAAKRFEIVVDKTRILSDNNDVTVVTVSSEGKDIGLDVRGTAVTLPLVDGVGTLEIAATMPTVEPIIIKASNPMIYGHAKVEVIAT